MPVLYWNDVALEANKESHSNGAGEQTGPTLSSRALAIVHLAIHDAVVALNPGIIINGSVVAPYLNPVPTPIPAPAATASAVAAAAYRTLSVLFPAQAAMLSAKLASAPMSNASHDVAGRVFGLQVADAILKLRKDDDDAKSTGHMSVQSRFRHRPDPDNPGQGYHAAFYGNNTKLFATQGTPPALLPPPLGNAEYNTAVVQVYRDGIKQELQGTLPVTPVGGNRRTPTETLIGVFWGYDGAKGLGTPPRLYNQIVRQVMAAQEKKNPPATPEALLVGRARLLALVNVAMADSGILAWKEKYKYDLWRPVVGVREHDDAMGPQGSGTPNLTAACDPFWLPLGAPNSNRTLADHAKNPTPPFPAYPSGHATFGAAAFQVARRFYNDNAALKDDLGKDENGNLMDFVSDELNGQTTDNHGTVRPRHARKFPNGLWQAMRENGESRVYLGVHWIFDAFRAGDDDFSEMIGGVPLGRAIADNIVSNNLTQVP